MLKWLSHSRRKKEALEWFRDVFDRLTGRPSYELPKRSTPTTRVSDRRHTRTGKREVVPGVLEGSRSKKNSCGRRLSINVLRLNDLRVKREEEIA